MNVESMLTTYQFEQWLYQEAKYLDDINFDAWFGEIHPDIEYQMPIRINLEGNIRPDYSEDMFVFDDDYHLLKMRVDRLKTEYAWAELPPSRTRRIVSNVRVEEYIPNEKAIVSSYLLMYRSRSKDIHHDLISGERKDEFTYIDGKWKLSKRFFLVDQTTLDTRNMAIFV